MMKKKIFFRTKQSRKFVFSYLSYAIILLTDNTLDIEHFNPKNVKNSNQKSKNGRPNKMKAVIKEISHNRILALGISLLITAFLVAMLSAYPEYRAFGILAAVLAIFGAALAIRAYLSFIGELKRKQMAKSETTP